MDKRPWNKKERQKKVMEIHDRESVLLHSTCRTFITNNGFVVILLNIFTEKITAYYVDRQYNDVIIGIYEDDEKLYEKIEKFRFEKEGALDNETII